MSEPPTTNHQPPTRIKRLWSTIRLDDVHRITHGAVLMLFALDDLARVRCLEAAGAVAVWRRYLASNLDELEWSRKGWRRRDADRNAARALRELADDVAMIRHGRIIPTRHHLLASLRERYAAAMPVAEFIAHCTSTYESKTGRFAH